LLYWLIALLAVTAHAATPAPAAAADLPLQCAGGSKAADVRVVRTLLAGVPALVRLPRSVSKPPILLWHGFGPPASESALMEALPLDDVPSIKVYLGLPLFGDRAPTDPNDSVGKRQAEDYALRVFKPAVLGAAKELPAVVAALDKAKCMRAKDAVGLFGFSAGGAAVLLALAERDIPVSAAVTVNAPTSLNVAIDALERATKRPYTWSNASDALAERSDIARRAADVTRGNRLPAVLLYHGADDTVVTPAGATALQLALQPYYERAGVSDRLKVVIAPGVSHDWTDERTLASLRASVAEWFNQHSGNL
jgi:pimeloyl-ACP methyl ester carboxylesterase